MSQATPEVRMAKVRALPMPGHKRRWCGAERWVPNIEKRPEVEIEQGADGSTRPKLDSAGKPIYVKHALPWPDFEIKVRIVDNPQPFNPDHNGGVPVEISPTTFAMLQKDERIMAQIIGADGIDAAAVVQSKAEAAKLEEQLTDARRENAELAEQLKSFRHVTEEEHKASDAKIKALEAQLAAAQRKK